MLSVIPFVLGPVETNCYLVGDNKSGEAVMIDPAWDGNLIVEEAIHNGLSINAIWLTHAHFDHIAGVGGICCAMELAPPVALHKDDLFIWQAEGGAPLFGLHIDPGPEPSIMLVDRQILEVGEYQFEVRHTPGHTPGHVVFYCRDEELVFCGDVIFQNGIGRTDLPGGSYRTLMNSIKLEILSLPNETRLLSGHGFETTVGDERRNNPFLV